MSQPSGTQLRQTRRFRGSVPISWGHGWSQDDRSPRVSISLIAHLRHIPSTSVRTERRTHRARARLSPSRRISSARARNTTLATGGGCALVYTSDYYTVKVDLGGRRACSCGPRVVAWSYRQVGRPCHNAEPCVGWFPRFELFPQRKLRQPAGLEKGRKDAVSFLKRVGFTGWPHDT